MKKILSVFFLSVPFFSHAISQNFTCHDRLKEQKIDFELDEKSLSASDTAFIRFPGGYADRYYTATGMRFLIDAQIGGVSKRIELKTRFDQGEMTYRDAAGNFVTWHCKRV